MSEQPMPSPGASRQQRRAVVLAVASDAAVAALFLLLIAVVASGMTAMTGWRPKAAIGVAVLVTIPLLARQVWRGRRALAAPESEPRLAPPVEPADSDRPDPAIRDAAPIGSTKPAPAVERAEPGERVDSAQLAEPASSASAERPHDGRQPVGNLPTEIGISLIRLARREVRVDSAAVLVPDAGTWMVISDADLPEANGTLHITAADQMIREVLHAGSPRIVDGWDRSPREIAELPWRASDHLLAVPLRQAESVILLSRAHPPFHREEVRLLSSILDLQGTMLDLALKMRKLREDLDEALEAPAVPAGPSGRRPGPEDPPTGHRGRDDD